MTQPRGEDGPAVLPDDEGGGRAACETAARAAWSVRQSGRGPGSRGSGADPHGRRRDLGP